MATVTWNPDNPLAVVSPTIDIEPTDIGPVSGMSVFGDQTVTSFGLQTADHATAIVFTGTGFTGYSSHLPAAGVITGYAEFDLLHGGVNIFTVSGLNLQAADFNFYVSNNIYAGLAGIMFSGNDTFTGGPNADQIKGYDGVDIIHAGGGDDVLYADGSLPGEVYDGGAGRDQLVVGIGPQIDPNTGGPMADFTFDTLASIEIVKFAGINLSGTGDNTAVFSSAQLGDGISPTATIQGDGVWGHNLWVDMAAPGTVDLSGWSFSNWDAQPFEHNLVYVYGTDGADTITGTSQDDRLYGETVYGAGPFGPGSADTIHGGAGNDQIYGRGGADHLFGDAGADTLDGGLGADVMSGGTGDDTFYVDNVGDVVIENPGEGSDTLITTLDHWAPLEANVENLNMSASATAVGAVGNSLDNVITGSSLGNYIDGAAGADTMIGGDGNDWYNVDNPGDVVIEQGGNGDADFIVSTVSYALPFNVEQLWLTYNNADINGTGNNLDNGIVGNNGVNTLDGQDGNDWLLGYGGHDTLIGGPGNDWLDGGTGADTMIGGTGNDIYFIDNPGDVIIENPGDGADSVVSKISYTLPDNVDQLWFTDPTVINVDLNGTGNALDNGLVGNNGVNVLDGQGGNDWLLGYGGNDILIGGAGNDWLDGGVGADTMSGGTGDDIYIVDNVADVVLESAGEGNDSIASTVSYTLPANVEGLFFSQNQANIDGTGNGLDNILSGNNGDNRLSGLGGADILVPWGGNDTLTGGAGNDTFVFHPGAGSDLITDFTPGNIMTGDVLDLSALAAAGVTWSIAQMATDTVFSFSDGGQVVLAGVLMGDLQHPSANFYL